MRFTGHWLPLLFTLLLTVQGECVRGARTEVIVRTERRALPDGICGVCVPVRLSCDGVPVCSYDARLADGRWVASLTAAELSASGVRLLGDVLSQWRGRELHLLLELCPPVAERLSAERQAERDFVWQRADSTVLGLVRGGAAAAGGCEALAEAALRTAREAGFRHDGVWLLTDDAAVCAHYGGRSSKVRVFSPSEEGLGPAVRGVALHRSRIASKADVKRLRKGGRRVAVWDVNSAEDAEAMRGCKVDYILTDDPESLGDPSPGTARPF